MLSTSESEHQNVLWVRSGQVGPQLKPVHMRANWGLAGLGQAIALTSVETHVTTNLISISMTLPILGILHN